MKSTATQTHLAMLDHDAHLDGIAPIGFMPVAPPSHTLQPPAECGIGPLIATRHAQLRMAQRAICADAVMAAVDWGSARPDPGGTRYTVGRGAMDAARRQGIDLRVHAGVVAVVSGRTVVTTYRYALPATLGRDRERARRRVLGGAEE